MLLSSSRYCIITLVVPAFPDWSTAPILWLPVKPFGMVVSPSNDPVASVVMVEGFVFSEVTLSRFSVIV
jgi:hypothetical protein